MIPASITPGDVIAIGNSLIQFALRRGEIIEEGDYQELLEQGGHYVELYNTYFRHLSLEYIDSAKYRLLRTPEVAVLE